MAEKFRRIKSPVVIVDIVGCKTLVSPSVGSVVFSSLPHGKSNSTNTYLCVFFRSSVCRAGHDSDHDSPGAEVLFPVAPPAHGPPLPHIACPRLPHSAHLHRSLSM